MIWTDNKKLKYYYPSPSNKIGIGNGYHKQGRADRIRVFILGITGEY